MKKTVAEEFPAFDPDFHDPTACTRASCRRCAPHTPVLPRRVDHHVARYVDRTASPFDGLPRLLRSAAQVTDPDLAKAMSSLADAIRDHGKDRWQRLLAWEARTIGVSLTHHEPGDDPDEDAPRPAVSLTEEKYRAEEARASGFAQDARTAAGILPGQLRNLPATERAVKNTVLRVRFLLAVAEARKPRRLLSREQTAAQVAADGWCKSCYRVGVFELIDRRPTGEPYYVDLCRWCGSHKAGLPQPPIDMVKIHHHIHVRDRKAS